MNFRKTIKYSVSFFLAVPLLLLFGSQLYNIFFHDHYHSGLLIGQQQLAVGNVFYVTRQYFEQCKSFPDNGKFLAILAGEAKVSCWSGPYLEKNKQNDPAGGKIRVLVEKNKISVSVSGLDGKYDTDDDFGYSMLIFDSNENLPACNSKSRDFALVKSSGMAKSCQEGKWQK